MKSINIAGQQIRLGTIFKENDPAFSSCKTTPNMLKGSDFYAIVSIDDILRESTLSDMNMRDAELMALCRQILDNLSDHFTFLIQGDVLIIHRASFLVLHNEKKPLEEKNLIFGIESIYSHLFTLIHLYYGKLLVSEFPLLSQEIHAKDEIPLQGILIQTEKEINQQEIVELMLNHMYLPQHLYRMENALIVIDEILRKYPVIQISDISQYEEIYQRSIAFQRKGNI